MRWEEGWWEVVTVDHDDDDAETLWRRSPAILAAQAGSHEWCMGDVGSEYMTFKTTVY